MTIQKKLWMGVLLFALTIAFSIPLQTSKVYAAEATSEDQLREFAATLKTVDENTIQGKLGNQTITFKKGNVTGPGGTPTQIQRYTAQNLDCNGEKATIGINPGQAVRAATLTAKYKDERRCSNALTIPLNLTSEGQIDGSDEEAGGGGGDSCETSNSGPLGWILCPIIDAAATFTQYVFDNFVKPFLEDVPVTTDESDGSYQAWKQFRLIGNIVLVGTMIAVVYAQVRGDR